MIAPFLLKEILRLDFKRVEKESRTSPKIFHDRGFGSYGMPTDILPIDRIIEQLMRAAAVAQKDAVETEFVPPIREAQIGPNMQATQWRPPMYPMQPPGAARNMIPVPAGQILTPQDLRNPYGQHPYHHQHVAQPALYPQNVGKKIDFNCVSF